MSLMQLPAPNTSAKVIVSFRYATAIWVMHSAKSMPAGRARGRWRIVIHYSPLLGGLFKLENATTLAF